MIVIAVVFYTHIVVEYLKSIKGHGRMKLRTLKMPWNLNRRKYYSKLYINIYITCIYDKL